MSSILVYTRNVYGVPKVYAADPSQAAHLSVLTGARTLEHRHLQALEALGHAIEQVPDPKAPVLTTLKA